MEINIFITKATNWQQNNTIKAKKKKKWTKSKNRYFQFNLYTLNKRNKKTIKKEVADENFYVDVEFSLIFLLTLYKLNGICCTIYTSQYTHNCIYICSIITRIYKISLIFFYFCKLKFLILLGRRNFTMVSSYIIFSTYLLTIFNTIRLSSINELSF